uniref:Uncharacterized protein n=1 Tax=Lactuca sativa TaxID=4236 RepID=A0A9R1VZQ6_LACSA|nr:hypothetical protein LSAT_V11C300120910 [Lactuca sativa]
MLRICCNNAGIKDENERVSEHDTEMKRCYNNQRLTLKRQKFSSMPKMLESSSGSTRRFRCCWKTFVVVGYIIQSFGQDPCTKNLMGTPNCFVELSRPLLVFL